jgi:hypothetical protein
VDSRLVPIGSVKVRIQGQEVTTDTQGKFSLAGVTTPYDTLLAVSAAGKNYGVAYQGLSRTDPTLHVPGYPSPAPQSGIISGTFNLSANGTRGFIFANLDGVSPTGQNGTAFPQFGSNYETTIRWFGATPTTAHVQVITWKETLTGEVETFLHAQSANVSINNGGQVTLNVEPTTPLGSVTVDGQVVTPSNFRIVSRRAFVRSLSKDGSAMLVDDLGASLPAEFQHVMPSLPDFVPVVCAAIKPQNALEILYNYTIQCRAVVNGQQVDLTPPAPPKLLQPPNNQTGVNVATDFSWDPVPGAVHMVVLDAASSFFVITMANQTKIPDLSTLGVPLPQSTKYTYSVSAIGPFASMDEIAGPQGFLEPVMSYADKRSPRIDGFAGHSAPNSITTQ